jgi:hypothetical protein
MKKEKALAHLLWMCHNMPNKEDNPFKWNRWLGYIQGQLVLLELISLSACKDLNKQSLYESGFKTCWSIINANAHGIIPERIES